MFKYEESYLEYTENHIRNENQGYGFAGQGFSGHFQPHDLSMQWHSDQMSMQYPYYNNFGYMPYPMRPQMQRDNQQSYVYQLQHAQMQEQ